MKNIFALGRIFKKSTTTKNAEPTISIDDVKKLVEKIKEFNAGVIDAILSRHCDAAFEEWKKSIEGESDGN